MNSYSISTSRAEKLTYSLSGLTYHATVLHHHENIHGHERGEINGQEFSFGIKNLNLPLPGLSTDSIIKKQTGPTKVHHQIKLKNHGLGCQTARLEIPIT